jgi:hypothetical protein
MTNSYKKPTYFSDIDAFFYLPYHKQYAIVVSRRRAFLNVLEQQLTDFNYDFLKEVPLSVSLENDYMYWGKAVRPSEQQLTLFQHHRLF